MNRSAATSAGVRKSVIARPRRERQRGSRLPFAVDQRVRREVCDGDVAPVERPHGGLARARAREHDALHAVAADSIGFVGGARESRERHLAEPRRGVGRRSVGAQLDARERPPSIALARERRIADREQTRRGGGSPHTPQRHPDRRRRNDRNRVALDGEMVVREPQAIERKSIQVAVGRDRQTRDARRQRAHDRLQERRAELAAQRDRLDTGRRDAQIPVDERRDGPSIAQRHGECRVVRDDDGGGRRPCLAEREFNQRFVGGQSPPYFVDADRRVGSRHTPEAGEGGRRIGHSAERA